MSSLGSPEWNQVYDQLKAHPCVRTDQAAQTNLNVYRPRHMKMLESVKKYLAPPYSTVLDVGSHDGFFLQLSTVLGFKQFIGVDFFEMPPERSFFPGLKGSKFIHANFNEPGFLRIVPDESVDCVTSTEVFEHLFNHPFAYLEECWRVLRPEGVLLFTTPNPATLINAVRILKGTPITWGDRMFAMQPKITNGNQPAAFWDIHFREYPQQELRDILSQLPGARIVDSGFIANYPDSVDGRGKKLTKKLIWKAGLGHSRLFSASQYFVLKKF